MPFDVIKTRQQASDLKAGDIKTELQDLKNKYGIKGLFKGVSPVLIRGFLVNAVTFCVYKKTIQILEKN